MLQLTSSNWSSWRTGSGAWNMYAYVMLPLKRRLSWSPFKPPFDVLVTRVGETGGLPSVDGPGKACAIRPTSSSWCCVRILVLICENMSHSRTEMYRSTKPDTKRRNDDKHKHREAYSSTLHKKHHTINVTADTSWLHMQQDHTSTTMRIQHTLKQE